MKRSMFLLLLLLVPVVCFAGFCEQCGNEFAPTAQFCSKCGASVGHKVSKPKDLRITHWKLCITGDEGSFFATKTRNQLRLYFKSADSAQMGNAMAIYEVGKNWDKKPRLVGRGLVVKRRPDGVSELGVVTCSTWHHPRAWNRNKKPVRQTNYIVSKSNHTTLSNKDFVSVLKGDVWTGLQGEYVEAAWGKLKKTDKIGNQTRQFHGNFRLVYVKDNKVTRVIKGEGKYKKELEKNPEVRKKSRSPFGRR